MIAERDEILKKALLAVLLIFTFGAAAEQLSPTANNVPGPFFGLDVHRLASSTPWPSTSFGSLRLWDSYTDWPHLEPQPGKWEFKNLDADVNVAESHHVQVMLTLGLTPAWASSKPNEKSGAGLGNAAPEES